MAATLSSSLLTSWGEIEHTRLSAESVAGGAFQKRTLRWRLGYKILLGVKAWERKAEGARARRGGRQAARRTDKVSAFAKPVGRFAAGIASPMAEISWSRRGPDSLH